MNILMRHAIPACLFATALTVSVAQAFTPTIEIVEPSGTQYVDGFPVDVQVVMEISLRGQPTTGNPLGNCMTNAVNSIEVEATHESGSSNVIHSVSNPSLGNLCPATYSFSWEVQQPGSYSLVITAVHGNDEGEAVETVEFITLAVEYPAPPAQANAYINANEYLKSLPGKQRGCVISMVADKHAKLAGSLEGYGPKGGPYDGDMIEQDVEVFFGVCASGNAGKR